MNKKILLLNRQDSGNKKETSVSLTGTLFENLITFDEFKRDILRNHYSRSSIYRWIAEGMPSVRLKGKRWIVWPDAALWLERSSK